MATSTLGSGTLVLAGTTSGTTTVTATAVAGTTTLTLPAATDTLVGKATTDTLTNKTLTGAVMNGTLGATTPSTGAFTTLTSTGASSFATSSGSVGIGTSSPSNPLHIVSNTVSQLNVAASSGNTNAQINLEPTGTGIALIGPANSVAFAFRTNATERARFNSTGALVFAGGTTTADGIGITFPATQSASSNVNTLDDYEEGTFTPTCTLATPGTSATTSAAGFYTKVGNLVTVTGRLTFTKGTGSGDLSLGGLPFAATNTSLYQSSGALSLDTFGVTGKVYYIIIAQNSTAPSLVSVTQAGGAAVSASASDFGASGAAIRYMFSYQV